MSDAWSDIYRAQVEREKREAGDEAVRLVKEHFGNDYTKAMAWFTTPNPMLGDVKPVTMLLTGRGDRLLQMVRNMLDGNLP